MGTSTFQDNGSLHKYRTEIPNIIFELGLDPYALAVYLIFKKIAGDHGKCWASQESIANMCGMGITKLKEVKKILQQPFELLDGLPLIRIKKRQDSGESDVIVIEDIWEKNFEHLSIKNKNKGASPNDGGGCRETTGGASPRDTKEEPLKKNQIKEEPSSSLSPPSPESKEEFKMMMMKILPFDDEEFEEAYKKYFKPGSPSKPYPEMWFNTVISSIQSEKKKLQNDEKPKFLEYSENEIQDSIARIQQMINGDFYGNDESRIQTPYSL